jgi:hypothetical protein
MQHDIAVRLSVTSSRSAASCASLSFYARTSFSKSSGGIRSRLGLMRAIISPVSRGESTAPQSSWLSHAPHVWSLFEG